MKEDREEKEKEEVEAKSKSQEETERPRSIKSFHFSPLNAETQAFQGLAQGTAILSEHDAGPIALLCLN